MGRQRFLHHYLPAHLVSVLVAGALVELVFNVDPIGASTIHHDKPKFPKSKKSRHFVTARERMGRKSFVAVWLVSITVLVATAWGFWFFAPLTYGAPGLNPAQVNARKWLSYDFHFTK